MANAEKEEVRIHSTHVSEQKVRVTLRCGRARAIQELSANGWIFVLRYYTGDVHFANEEEE